MTEYDDRNDLRMLYSAVDNSIQFPDEETRTKWEDIAIAIFHASPVSDYEKTRVIGTVLARFGVDRQGPGQPEGYPMTDSPTGDTCLETGKTFGELDYFNIATDGGEDWKPFISESAWRSYMERTEKNR
tara:strand:+ start:264 stop:650 length:387 start_codon:yes stop_codon:yes gene_type:complete